MAASTESQNKPKVEAAEVKAAKSVTSLPDNKRPPGDLRRRGRQRRRKGPFVKYVGAAAVRRISAPQWRSLGIDLKDEKADHVWSIDNEKMIELDKFSDDQLDYLLIDDLQQGSNAHAFLVVDYDDKGQLVQVEIE